MKLTRKDPSKGKKIVVATLIAALTVTGISNIKTSKDKEKPSIVTETAKPEIPLDKVENENHEKIVIEVVNLQKENDSKKNKDIEKIFEEDLFHFSYENRTNNENIINAKRYEDIFEKYANIYGLDKNLLMALSAQESCGDHYNNLDNSPACGIMQIEKKDHIGHNVSAYNFNTKKIETIKINDNNIRDLDTNIKIGTMILRNHIENNNYNIPIALQTYNFGTGNMNKVLNACSYSENISIEEMTNKPTYNSWLYYRNYLHTGDPQYVEHVFSFLDNNTELTVLDRNCKEIKIKLVNDYKKSKHR